MEMKGREGGRKGKKRKKEKKKEFPDILVMSMQNSHLILILIITNNYIFLEFKLNLHCASAHFPW